MITRAYAASAEFMQNNWAYLTTLASETSKNVGGVVDKIMNVLPVSKIVSGLYGISNYFFGSGSNTFN